jgi:hypothetical protein
MMTPKRLAGELDARLDGPHADEHTAGAAYLAAECIRFLNYATGSHSPQGLVFPSTAYEVTADLALATGRMPQLLRQILTWLAAEDAAGHLAMDDHTPASAAVARAGARLGNAVRLADQLAGELALAQEAITYLNGRGPNRPGGAL